MKKLRLTILLCCCLMPGQPGIAQRAAVGLFATAADFYNHRLSEHAVRGSRHIVRPNEDFYLRFVTVLDRGVRRRYPKDSLFGYMDSYGRQFRFFRRSTYEVLNGDSGLLLYRQTIIVGGKAPQNSACYYFSQGAGATIQPLTRKALRAAYGNDETFLIRVLESFPDDGSLAQYDNYVNAYKLVCVYKQTHK